MKRAPFVLGLSALLSAATAQAYRPFDGTDAAVGEVGALTVEAGPAQFYRSQGQSYFAPALVLNFGLAERFEAIVDARQWVAHEAVPNESRVRELDSAVVLKWLAREGTLQDASGVSVALEGAVLLPEVHGEDGFGVDVTAAVSYGWDWGTLHANQSVGRSRLGNLVLSNSLIAEASDEWVVRPVVELSSEQELDEGASYAFLVGAIATASDTLAFDAGLRAAREDEQPAFELRFGLTWNLTVVEPSNR